MTYSQGAQKTGILKEVSFWVISSYTVVKTDRQKQVPVLISAEVMPQSGHFRLGELLQQLLITNKKSMETIKCNYETNTECGIR
jgi:hypothetical protein